MSEARPAEDRGRGGALAIASARPPVPRPPVADPAPGIALRDVLTTVFLRRWLVLAAFLAPIALSVAAALVLSPRWPAEGLLLVQVSREATGASDLTGTGPTVVSVEMPKVVQSEYELMMSDAVLRRALAAAGPGRIFPGLGEPRLFGLLPRRRRRNGCRSAPSASAAPSPAPSPPRPTSCASARRCPTPNGRWPR
ncbi:Wzz/FepE/Etk N-terminal domain-containing protein [Roseomonas sp. CCTCC AB2023176]|uniref:Wzz/FepE/Etk N-terminal domain-containing protein n=1 Tax=Roseomonas sp. CCTCC AB2023176 TaxID=3342640 RepID=UPI0035E114DE